MQRRLLTAIRSPDNGPFQGIRQAVRWVRECTQNTNDSIKEILPDASALGEELWYCSLHFVEHLMRSFQIISYEHPNDDKADAAYRCYCHIAIEMLHLKPESEISMRQRYEETPRTRRTKEKL